MTKPSVGIIGAGISGLFAAAFLAQAGFPVTLIEKATTVGGSAGYYRRRGEVFPTGATVAFGLEPGGLLRGLLDDLHLPLDVKPLPHAMDVVLPDRTVSVYLDRQLWEHELTDKFPEQKDAVLHFWRHLAQIASDVLDVSKTRIALPPRHFSDLGRFPSFALRHPAVLFRTGRHSLMTVHDLLKRYGLEHYQPFVQFLNAQLIDATQVDVTRSALLPSSLALDVYRHGSFYIPGGFGTLAVALWERILALGGEVVLAQSVSSCQYDSGKKVWHVRTNRGMEFTFATLLNASGVEFPNRTADGYDTYRDFAAPPSTAASSIDATEAVASDEWGAVRLDMTAKGLTAGPSSSPLPFAYQMIPSADHARLWGDPHGPVYMTIHPRCDVPQNQQASESGLAGVSSPDSLLITVSVHSPAKQWLGLSKEAYSSLKKEVTEAILTECERVLPDLRESLLSCHTGTPATYQRYVGKAQVGGRPLTVQNAVLFPRGARGEHKQLFYAGENRFPGPGTLSAALSGYFAARAIQNQNLG
ncbi:phytoene desaturase family protein [Brevibacillus dissolubilis]|uniref:phytoene desaturase family protein n=1 Tax=Brevibacillus dissolubilis TaxID=1844116 RepID=UPI00159BB693|nr:FAD-dependent oxidoreductase [Brevibacillus dissolubilis]